MADAAKEYRAVRLSREAGCRQGGPTWLILPSESLRALVRRRTMAARPWLNYVCEWRDTHGFGLHLAHADWVGPGQVYVVPG